MSIPLEIALHCLDRSSAFTANRYNSAGNTEMGPQDAPLYGRQAIYALHQRVKLLPPQGEHNSVLVHNVIMNYTLYKNYYIIKVIWLVVGCSGWLLGMFGVVTRALLGGSGWLLGIELFHCTITF